MRGRGRPRKLDWDLDNMDVREILTVERPQTMTAAWMWMHVRNHVVYANKSRDGEWVFRKLGNGDYEVERVA